VVRPPPRSLTRMRPKPQQRNSRPVSFYPRLRRRPRRSIGTTLFGRGAFVMPEPRAPSSDRGMNASAPKSRFNAGRETCEPAPLSAPRHARIRVFGVAVDEIAVLASRSKVRLDAGNVAFATVAIIQRSFLVRNRGRMVGLSFPKGEIRHIQLCADRNAQCLSRAPLEQMDQRRGSRRDGVVAAVLGVYAYTSPRKAGRFAHDILAHP